MFTRRFFFEKSLTGKHLSLLQKPFGRVSSVVPVARMRAIILRYRIAE